MDELQIERHINDVLDGETRKLTLDFVEYLKSMGMQFEKGTGYWDDKRYWMVKNKDAYVCFILVNGYGCAMHRDEPEGFIIWSDDSGSTDWFALPLPDEQLAETAWTNVDHCGHCGGRCDGGFHKTIFGREFKHVCNTTFRFDNPDENALLCAKKLIGLRINYLPQ
jgi:hypothetical protein